MSDLTVDVARALIAKLREDNGGISPEDRTTSSPSVLRVIRRLRQQLGAATRTLARNLYSKDTRFVYELIQNAEDNKYTTIAATGEGAFIDFTIEADRIIVDSNEDGFTPADVKAICSTGKSTKRAMQGYIGEKGIGFKSVFKIAKRVHVQSGPFSFAFQYDPRQRDWYTRDSQDSSAGNSDDRHFGEAEPTEDSDDDGLGMVTPMEETFEVLPPGVRTRVTLTLIESPMTKERCNELFDIPDTTLLFFSQLEIIRITLRLPHEVETITDFRYGVDPAREVEFTTKSMYAGSQTTSTTNLFRVFRKEITSLPPDEARPGSAFDRTTVVLAFPVDASEQPIVQPQHVFAFLPLREVGFTFLIQADFITQASREDIPDSPRNRCLRDGVAEAFQEAVDKFCMHPTLVYQWLKYLPDEGISDAFWKNLRPKIISRLRNRRILRTQSENLLYTPTRLRIVASACMDQDGNPLFEDLTAMMPGEVENREICLSRRYDRGDYERAKSLGVQVISITEVVERFEADLSRPESRFKGNSMNDDWHQRACVVLSRTFEDLYNSQLINRIKSLQMIPLQSGEWVSAQISPIYFPTTGDSNIPQDIGLNLVFQPATRLAARRHLFKYLGVSDCPVNAVVSRIYQLYALGRWPTDPEGHLLYLFENSSEIENMANVNIKVWIISDKSKGVWLSGQLKENMYFEEPNNIYGPSQLFRGETINNNLGSLQDRGIHFIHPRYASYFQKSDRHGGTFERWLEEIIGVHRVPQLTHHRRTGISAEFSHIIQCSPNKLVGVLREYWSAYRGLILNDGIREALRFSQVPVLGSGQRAALCSLYLPLPKLKNIMARAGVDANDLFLALPTDISDEDSSEWGFLKEFGVGINDDAQLYLHALSRQTILPDSSLGRDQVLPLYIQLAQRCSTDEATVFIRSQFQESRLIYLPQHGQPSRSSWISNGDCVWSGPDWLTTKRRMNESYGELRSFFQVTLRIRDFDWTDCYTELDNIKTKQERQHPKVLEIYLRLMIEFTHHSNWTDLQSEFENRRLVLVPEDNSWLPPSSCIWAETRTRIPGKQSIASSYHDIAEFFTRMLGVPKPDLGMHVQTLKELGRARDRNAQWLSHVKDTMMLISSMDPAARDLVSLHAANIFPVKTRQGDVRPTSSQVEFAIIDRPEFDGLFPNIVTLDFTLQEVHTFKRFLFAMGLAKKHMSLLIEEKTNVNGGALDTPMTEFLTLRAYALFRCAVYYNSMKTRDNDLTLFGQLRHAETYTSNQISKSLTCIQNGQEHTVEQQKANFHLDESNGRLLLYVPSNRNDRELCYLRQLPRRLLRFLAISDPAAEAVISGIVNGSRLSIVDEILSDAGVIEIAGIERPPEADDDDDAEVEEDYEGEWNEDYEGEWNEDYEGEWNEDYEGESNEANEGESNEAASSIEIASASGVQMLPRASVLSERSIVSESSSLHPSVGSPRAGTILWTAPPLAREISSTPEHAPYASLLDRIIFAASNAAFPRHNASAFPNSGNASLGPGSTIFGLRSLERNEKVGAAGELFVFELLSQLGLHNFGLANWQSTIRGQAGVCNKYRGLDDWRGRESADIVYDDSDGGLLRVILENGYVPPHVIPATRPKFYIEVKTTTGNLNDPFYVSSSQYDLMRSCQRQADVLWERIYLVMRVFHLESDRIGLRVYIDPITAREEGQLDFTVDTWTISVLSACG